MGNMPILLLLAVLAVATFTIAVAALVVTRRRRRRAKVSSTLGWITDLQLPFDTHVQRGASTDGPGFAVESTDEPLAVRALRAQVRTLETALEQEQTREVALHDETATTERLAVYRRQVELTLRAIGRQVEGDGSAERVTARISAALDRLDAPDDFARPALSPAGAVSVLSRPLAATHLHAVATMMETPEPPAPGDAPVAEEAMQPTETAEVDLARDPEPEVVLPVPPMAESEENRRRRRRFRGSAA